MTSPRCRFDGGTAPRGPERDLGSLVHLDHRTVGEPDHRPGVLGGAQRPGGPECRVPRRARRCRRRRRAAAIPSTDATVARRSPVGHGSCRRGESMPIPVRMRTAAAAIRRKTRVGPRTFGMPLRWGEPREVHRVPPSTHGGRRCTRGCGRSPAGRALPAALPATKAGISR